MYCRMFTWADAYYEGNQYPDKKSTAGTLNEGSYSHDPLGLAVAKMSYQVYSLGEGYEAYGHWFLSLLFMFKFTSLDRV